MLRADFIAIVLQTAVEG